MPEGLCVGHICSKLVFKPNAHTYLYAHNSNQREGSYQQQQQHYAESQNVREVTVAEALPAQFSSHSLAPRKPLKL